MKNGKKEVLNKMRKFKIKFIQTNTIQIEVEANNREEINLQADLIFAERVRKPEEIMQEGYWELCDIEDIKEENV